LISNIAALADTGGKCGHAKGRGNGDTIFVLDGLSKDSTMAALAAVGDAVTGFCEKIAKK